MTLTLEEAISKVTLWKNAKDITCSELGGGITNHNYRVDVDGESYVLRIVGSRTELLGINREDEYIANLEAGKLGIAPEVVFFIRPEGYLITRFIKGSSLTADEIRQPQSIRSITEMLKRIHSMPPVTGTFDAFRIVENYTKIAQQYGVAFPANFDWLITEMRKAEQALSREAYIPTPCHNDLLTANFLCKDSRIFIIDWEYAGMGDIYFDLANLSVNQSFSDEQDHILLSCYFGEENPSRWARLKVMKIMSDFREAMWGTVQVGISDLDEDFRGYADKHFSRLTNNIKDPRWGIWLKEI